MASKPSSYPVLDPVSQAYPEVQGRSPTCYSPVRHSSTPASRSLSVRLACVKHAASVHPEPGSNSPQKQFQQKQAVKSPNPTKNKPNTQHPKPGHQVTGKIQKLQRFNNQPPTRRGKNKGGRPKIRETCSTTPHAHYEPKKMTRSIIGIQPRHHRHTPTGAHHTVHKTRQANTPTQQKYIGTLSSSQTTPAHPNQPHTTVSQPQVTLESASDCFPARHTNRKESHSPAGRCRSR